MIMRNVLAFTFPALAGAVLRECANDPGEFTGIEACSGGPLRPNCPATLRMECDTMYDFTQYTDSGIPCSTGTAGCSPGDEIAFPNADYPIEALDALNDVVAARLVRGANNNDGITAGMGDLLDTDQLELYLSSDAHLNVTFLSEGACDRNSFGFVLYSENSVTNGDPRDMTFKERRNILRDEVTFTIMFPNVDLEFCVCDAPGTPENYDDFCTETVPELSRGTTMRMLPNFRDSRSAFLFPEGKFLSPFILDDGFDKGFQPGQIWAQPIENTLFSTPELNDPDMIRQTGPGGSMGDDLRQHAFVFRGPSSVTVPSTGEKFDFYNEIFFCFEDRRRFAGGRQTDNDFEDLCFFITADPPLEGFDPSAAPTNAPQQPSEAPTDDSPGSVCSEGLLSECGNVCCAASCGTCGGCFCASLDGGLESCCPSAILFAGIECVTSGDVACIVDSSVVCPGSGTGCD